MGASFDEGEPLPGPGGHFGSLTWAEAREKMIKDHKLKDIPTFNRALMILASLSQREQLVFDDDLSPSQRRERARDAVGSMHSHVELALENLRLARACALAAVETVGDYLAPASILEEVIDVDAIPFDSFNNPPEYELIRNLAHDFEGLFVKFEEAFSRCGWSCRARPKGSPTRTRPPIASSGIASATISPRASG